MLHTLQLNGPEKLKQLVSPYENVEDKLTFTENQIITNLVSNDIKANLLEIGKEHFVKDFDGCFCDYYLVKRVDEESVLMIPLWFKEENESDSIFVSGEGNDKVFGFVLQLNTAVESDIFSYEVIANEFSSFKRQSEDSPFTLEQYWILSNCTFRDIPTEEAEKFYYSFVK